MGRPAACPSTLRAGPAAGRGAVAEASRGALAGMLACLVSHPADVVLRRLQLHGELTRQQTPTWRQAARGLLAGEGVGVLRRGLTAGLAYNALVNSARFGAYAQLQKQGCGPLGASFLAGLCGGVVASPLNALKARLQACSARTFQAEAAALLAEGGPGLGALRGPFRGASVCGLRVAGSTCAQFAVYDEARRLGCGPLASGVGAAVSTALAVHPLDVVATRLYRDGARKYRGPLDCAGQTLAAEGLGGLLKGVKATAIRQLPHTACTLVFIELLRERVM